MENKQITTIIIVILAIIVIISLISPMYSYGMMPFFSGMWFFGWLFMALITIALVLFIIWLVQQIQKGGKY